MPLKIKRTGLDQYAPGGDARIRMLVVGGPGAGKTRMSSYWPRPIVANCEAGLASVADRAMPYVDITNSREMLEFLNDMQKVCRIPYKDREFQTVVIDTLDAFQRKVKDEYLQTHPEMQSFRGFDAYGYLEAKTGATLTRLLNLDMNIIINVHYKDKTIREGTGENATERQELMLQLIGDVKDSIFNDFDLVGWLGTYWKPGPEGGESRVEARGLTFRRTPERPFLKDRLNVTPPWMEVVFSDDDYYNLFAAVIDRLDSIPETTDVREIEGLGPEQGGSAVVLTGGALPPQQAAQVPLAQLDKPSLQMKIREWSAKAEEIKADLPEAADEINAVVAAMKFGGNTTKGELLAKLDAAKPILTDLANRRKAKKEGGEAAPADEAAAPQSADSVASAATPAPAVEQEAPQEPTEAAPAEAPAAETPVTTEEPQQAEPEPTPEPTPEPATTPAEPEVAPAAETPVATEVTETKFGTEAVDTATGELPPAPEGATADENVTAAAEALGGEVVSEPAAAEAPSEAPAPPPPAPAQPAAAPAPPAAAPAPAAAGGRQIPAVCQREGCDTELAGENQDYVKISFVKFRNFFCNKDFTEAKAAGKVPWPVKQAAA